MATDTSGGIRQNVIEVMNKLRDIAGAGIAVLLISSVGRVRNEAGNSSYDSSGMGLASFKESGEIEYGADDAYIMVPGSKGTDEVILQHVKSRYSQCADTPLTFDRRVQRFS